VGGAANAALLAFLARRLDVPEARLRWIQGLRGRTKRLAVDGLTDEEVAHRLGGPYDAAGAGSDPPERGPSRSAAHSIVTSERK
jgi:hypothetical protein